LARHRRGAAVGLALPAGGDGRGDAAGPLSAPGAALHGGAAPLPAVAAAGLRPRPEPGRRPLPVPAGHGRCRHAGRRRSALRRVRLAATDRARPRPVRPARPGSGGGMTAAGLTAAFADPCDTRLALGASGLLGEFNAAGVLSAADVHVARRLGRFGAEADDGVDLALVRAGLERLFPTLPRSAGGDEREDGGAGGGDEGPDRQRLAAATAVLRPLAVVAGGPGTGKTTTVARILALLDEQAE